MLQTRENVAVRSVFEGFGAKRSPSSSAIQFFPAGFFRHCSRQTYILVLPDKQILQSKNVTERKRKRGSYQFPRPGVVDTNRRGFPKELVDFNSCHPFVVPRLTREHLWLG
jgi:hypothetical protein